MDGLEWKRAKWRKPVRKFMKLFEKWGAIKSHALVADNDGIQKYLSKEYGKDSVVIPYGADIFNSPDIEVLKEYEVSSNDYFLLIARLEPENNIEMILDGFTISDSSRDFLVIGNHQTRYGRYLRNKFSHPNIRFLGSMYENRVINNLRYYSKAYFHGHSVGGTNPSLLEAMACRCLILAHDNIFNRKVLNGNAFFFTSIEDVRHHINSLSNNNGMKNEFVRGNIYRIKTRYGWDTIIDQYENFFKSFN